MVNLVLALAVAAGLDGFEKADLRGRASEVAANSRALGDAERRARVREALLFRAGGVSSPEDARFIADAADAACKPHDRPPPPVMGYHDAVVNGQVARVYGWSRGGVVYYYGASCASGNCPR